MHSFLNGVDDFVANALAARGVDMSTLRPPIGKYQYAPSMGAVAARAVLFVGTHPLPLFSYGEIRMFAAQVLSAIHIAAPGAAHLAMTIHGPGYGLDEVEACLSQVEGYLDALRKDMQPSALRRITIVDINPKRVARSREALRHRLPELKHVSDGTYSLTEVAPTRTEKAGVGTPWPVSFGQMAVAKNHIFVAMPFSTAMEDVYYYGIKGPVNALGYLCERVDHSVFTGTIVEYMLKKIEAASLVVADLTGSNPNVYLEVGYAWGKGRPTILLTQRMEDLPFDTKGHRCLEYQGIRDLEHRVTTELTALKTGGHLN